MFKALQPPVLVNSGVGWVSDHPVNTKTARTLYFKNRIYLSATRLGLGLGLGLVCKCLRGQLAGFYLQISIAQTRKLKF